MTRRTDVGEGFKNATVLVLAVIVMLVVCVLDLCWSSCVWVANKIRGIEPGECRNPYYGDFF